MPYMLQPHNYTQTMRPNLYNVAYRRVGAYKGMGRLHPSNYLDIGARPNRIGATAGQYNTLSTQLALLPPSLRGMGMLMRKRGLGQDNSQFFSSVTPVNMGTFITGSTTPTVGQSDAAAGNLLSPFSSGYVTTNAPGTGNVILPAAGTQTGISTNTILLIAGGMLLLVLLTGRR